MRRSALILAAVLTAIVARGATAGAADVPLVDAVKAGRADVVRTLLDQQADVNAADVDGSTALHWAVHRDDAALMQALLKAGANAGATNRYGVAPLTLAATNGSANAIELLLAAGADANTALPEGETVLMTAARTGRVEAVRLLLVKGAKVDAAESWRGQTALMWAALENNVQAVEALLAAGANPQVKSKSGFTALLFAVRAGRQPAAEALLRGGARVDEALPDGNTALHLAMINAHYGLGAWLLERGAPVNASRPGWTPLHQLIWTYRPNTNRGTLPAVRTGSLSAMDMARAFVKSGADLDARITKEPNDTHRHMGSRVGSTPLLLAAKAADADLMRLLVASGADPTLKTAQQTTVLMYAAGVGIWNVGESAGSNEEALEAVKMALESPGVDLNAMNDEGETALHGAAYRGANSMVELLVARGAHLDAKNKKGWTPLIIAEGVHYPNTFQRRIETAELLRKLAAARASAGLRR